MPGQGRKLAANFTVIIEFPDLEAANRWYDSAEYQPLKAIRLAATRGNMVFIDRLK